jgi:hypothetical protein
MKKIFILFVVLISTSAFAQKDQLIGSWMIKYGKAQDQYTVETFFPNGNYRTDVFVYAGNYICQLCIPKGLKWKVDEDGVLSTFGTPIASAAFVKITINDKYQLSPAEKKVLSSEIPSLEKKYTDSFRSDCNHTEKPSFFDFKFNDEGELMKKAAIEGGYWATFIKTDLPWTPPVKNTKNVKKR